jgi:hypothetical protein
MSPRWLPHSAETRKIATSATFATSVESQAFPVTFRSQVSCYRLRPSGRCRALKHARKSSTRYHCSIGGALRDAEVSATAGLPTQFKGVRPVHA